MPRFALIALGAGAVSALLHFAAMSSWMLGIPLALFTQLPLFLVGLGYGTRAVAYAGGAGVVLTGLIAGLFTALNFAVVDAVPVALVVFQALRSRTGPDGEVNWYPLGLLVMWLTVYAAAVLVLASILLSGAEGGMEGVLRDLFVDTPQDLAGPPVNPQIEAMIDALVPMLPGFALTMWMLVVAINGALAQTILVRNGRNLRPSPDLAGLALPNWMMIAVAAACVVAFLGPGALDFIGQNLALVLAVPFFFSGLALIHMLARRSTNRRVLLVLFYALLVFSLMMMGWRAIVPVAALGLISHLANLRRRFGGPGQA